MRRDSALVIRMAFPGGWGAQCCSGVRGLRLSEEQTVAELGGSQTTRQSWERTRPSGFRSGLLGAGKASLGEVHLWTFSETGGVQVGGGGEKQGEGSFKNGEV